MENQQNTNSPSHLHSRLKRKVAPTATIHEDNGAQPKEIKTVKIATAESLNYQGKLVRQNDHCQHNRDHKGQHRHGSCNRNGCCSSSNHEHAMPSQKVCPCKSLWRKLKSFTCRLLAIPSKSEEGCCCKQPHGHHGQRHHHHNKFHRRPNGSSNNQTPNNQNQQS
ncbi:MAG: hypothetical protein MJ218_03450 [Opitutales bacterium]|nr:hypothetical protein [Opitutales bacterium]